MRLRKEHGVLEELRSCPDQCVIASEASALPEWETVFGNAHPIHVEVGCGKGRFLVEKAMRNPDINFIGVELRDQILLRAVRKAQKQPLPNLRFLLINAVSLEDAFAPHSLDRIYLNFSDPWPKKRHYKRRLTYRDFLGIYDLILKEDSWVEFKTDNVVLFQFTLNELAALSLPMWNISLDVHADDRFDGNIMTEYEEKFSLKGQRIMAVHFKTHGAVKECGEDGQ